MNEWTVDSLSYNDSVGSRFTTAFVLEYLVVYRIVVKRVLFKWFKLRQVHGPNKSVNNFKIYNISLHYDIQFLFNELGI